CAPHGDRRSPDGTDAPAGGAPSRDPAPHAEASTARRGAPGEPGAAADARGRARRAAAHQRPRRAPRGDAEHHLEAGGAAPAETESHGAAALGETRTREAEARARGIVGVEQPAGDEREAKAGVETEA